MFHSSLGLEIHRLLDTSNRLKGDMNHITFPPFSKKILSMKPRKLRKMPSWKGTAMGWKGHRKATMIKQVLSGRRGKRQGLKQEKRISPTTEMLDYGKVRQGGWRGVADPSLATGPSSEDCGKGKDEVWEASRSRDCEKASGRALAPAKDKTSTG